MTRIGLLPLLSLVAACGCSSLGSIADLNPFAKKYVTADAKNPAIEVACIWQPDEGTNENGIPTRGFAGQVFFFTRSGTEPALVDGTMRVYLFADRGTPEERGKPIKQFDFTPEAWALHATLTSLGPGYGVFIPYPQSEPYQVRCQLRARFTPKEGPTLWSEAVTITLEGPPQPGAEPAWWKTLDGAPSPPTVIDAKITHETRSAAQAATSAAGQGDERSAAKKLRTDTFRLDEIQQAAFEVPTDEAAADAAPSGDRPVPALDASEIDPELLRELLNQQARRKTPAWKKPHPLERTSNAEAPVPRPSGRTATRPSRTPHPLEVGTPPAEPDASDEPALPRTRFGTRSLSKPPHPLSQRAAWKPLGSSLQPLRSAGMEASSASRFQETAGPAAGGPRADDLGDWLPLGS
jgi:hypothetical protein